jgi:hypothetical protein
MSAATEPSEIPRESRKKGIRPIRVTTEQRREGEARRKIAFILVWSYLGLIGLNVVAPVIIVKVVGTSNTQMEAIRSVSQGIAPLITGVVGVLGFVLGHYFRSDEK